MNAKIALADPPYLGRAAKWYGGKGTSKQGPKGRACGRGKLDREYHPDAAEWDDPQTHLQLIRDLDARFDGWGVAASPKTVAPLLAQVEALGGRAGVWIVTNAMPDGNRARCGYELLLFKQPAGRKAPGTGYTMTDVLIAPHPMASFVGSKPPEWTRWALDLIGYRPGVDDLEILFTGSGAVNHTAEGMLI